MLPSSVAQDEWQQQAPRFSAPLEAEDRQSGCHFVIFSDQGATVNGKAHGVQPIVNVGDATSNGRGQRGQQEGCYIADFGRFELLLDGRVCMGVPVAKQKSSV